MTNAYLVRFFDFVVNDSRLFNELQRVESEFPELEASESDRKLLVLDWFLFNYTLKGTGSTILDHFINVMKPELSEPDLRVYEGFLNNLFGIFEVKSVRIGKDLILKDLATEKEYGVRDISASKGLRKGQCIFIRLLPYQDHFILFGSLQAYSGEASQILRMTIKNLREGKADIRFSSKDLAELMHGSQAKDGQEEDFVAIAKRLEEKMARVGLSDVNLYQVMDDISNGRIRDVGVLHQEFHKKAKYTGPKDEKEFMDLLVALWNKMPHKVIGGVSPDEKMKMLKRGNMELSLITQLMEHLQVHFRLGKYTSEESRRRALRRVQMKWLDAKMPELDGKSPREIILEERKKLGNNDNQVGYKIDIHPLYDSDEDEEAEKMFKDGLRLTGQGKYQEAVEAYRRCLELYPDNYVAWGNLGSVFCLLVNKKEAERCLRTALSINPDYQTAKNNLSMLKQTSVRQMKEMSKAKKIKFHKS